MEPIQIKLPLQIIEHLAAAATLFRNVFDSVRQTQTYPGPFSPTSSSLSSRSLPSPITPSTTRKKSRLPKNKKQAIKLRRSTVGTREDFLNSYESINNNDDCYSIIRSREILNEGYNSTGGIGMTSYRKRSDDYGVSSDSDLIVNGRFKNDAKLRKRCAVVITPTKEIIQYERKRNEMYNEILQKQRRKLELRALEKQREKERRRLDRREEKREQTKSNNREAAATAPDKVATYSKKIRNYKEIFMSSESEYETNFQLRTHKHRQEKFQELEPLNIQIEMTEATTTSLLSQIDAHLDKPTTERTYQYEVKEKKEQTPSCNKDNNQQIFDISCDKNSPTKMRELNLLADIAQHLSPYQLDLPENNNPPRTPSPAYEPTPILIPPAAPTTQETKEGPKEKVTVTEHVIIQSLDNLLEKTNSQFNNNDQQQQTFKSYAHEPQLNMAATSKTSPCENVSQNENQHNNTQIENQDNSLSNNCTDKELNCNIQTDKALEQILEESMSVLKSVTSPFNALDECTAIRSKTCSDSTIPLLISSVESLNHIEQNETNAKPKSEDKLHLLLKDGTKNNFENIVSSEGHELHNNKETDETNKNVVVEQRKNETTAADLPSSILEQGETSIMCSTDLAHIPNNETETSQTLNTPSLLAADLSDISLESEISKNLPEIAEPSPVVTDMSDNSSESEVSKSFGLPTSITNTDTANASSVADMSLPDLSLVMTNIAQSSTLSTNHQQEPLESSFNQFNCTLNTPTKLAVETSKAEEPTNNSINDLNTPLKFAIQPEVESNSMPPKITLEPEADNNVTKFLDLILNKTVTDAESETRDKIIKELNALTADTTATSSSETSESITNNEVLLPEPNTGENAITDSKCIEENKTMEAKETEEVSNAFEEQTNSTKHKCKTQQNLEYSSKSHIENNSSAAETVEVKTTVKELSVSQIPSENNELNLNPPIESSVEETRSESLNDIATTELSDIEPSTSLSAFNKFKLPAVKQTFNIKCRVRLKRLNIDEHCKTPQKETWMAIPISKPEEPVSSNNHISKCDIAPETTTKIKKACLKQNNKQANEELEEKTSESFAQDTAAADEVIPCKKPMLEGEQTTQPTETTATVTAQQSPTPTSTPTQPLTQASSQATTALIFNTTSTSPPNSKSKSKPLKTVTFDLSNLNEELRESTASNHRQKSKSHHAASIAAGALGCYLKNSRPPRKLPDNTLRAAETLQIFVNTINDSTRTPPPAEFNKKRSPIKNKCIAEDETPRPPPASTLMDTPPCKKICTEKSRSQITSSKCKDQLVSSLSTASISSISDISTARIYTSSPLDQTLPEYDDNVDTVADSELILPPTAGSLRRKLKKPKKSMTRPEPVDDISTDDISNQPECNGEDDTDAVVDNEDDVFAEELLPIPAANEHILEEIVSGRPSHIGTGTVIRDDYMNIEATATVPVYLFNDESSDLVTPDPVQSSNTTNVVDSSSYLNTSPSAATNNVVAVIPASTTSAMVNLEKSMLSPSEHEVSSTQETFYQTPTKSKQPEACAEKSSTSKDKGNSSSAFLNNSISKQKPDDNKFQNNEQYQTSSTTGLLQNNQVDTTNHSPEMCTLSLTATTTTTTTLTSNRKIRKASTHDEILLNELQQQQLPSNKRKSTATFCCESTSDNNSNTTATKTKVVSKNLEDVKSNGALIKVEDKFKKLLKEVCKRDKNQIANDLVVGGLTVASNNSGGGGEGGGGSSPSTTTTILEEKIPRTKRKKQKSSKSKKNKSHSERSSKIVLKASKLTPHIPIPANPLIITIPKSRLLRPPATPTPPTAVEAQDEQQQNEFLDIPNAKLFIEKNKETTITTAAKNSNHHVNPLNHAVQPNAEEKQKIINATVAMTIEPKRPDSPTHTQTEIVNVKTNTIFESEMEEIIHKANSTIMPKKKSHSSTSATKKKEKLKTNHNANSSSTTCSNTNNNDNNNIIFVRDKYDLIKSKDKHHHQHHHDQHEQQQDVVKEKSKSKTNSQSKAATPNNTRLHKSSTKEKIKGEKHKGKHKGSEKSANQQLQPDIVLKLNTLQGSSSSSSTATTTLSSSNAKQSSSKAKRSNSSSSSSSSSATSAILKSKTNLSAT